MSELVDELVARGDVASLIPRYRSGAEADFARIGLALMGSYCECDVAVMTYEPEAFNLPGGHYTPDFRCILTDGRIVFIEIKGSREQKGYRDARSKLRAAAALNPWYTWYEVICCRGQWNVERIKAE